MWKEPFTNFFISDSSSYSVRLFSSLFKKRFGNYAWYSSTLREVWPTYILPAFRRASAKFKYGVNWQNDQWTVDLTFILGLKSDIAEIVFFVMWRSDCNNGRIASTNKFACLRNFFLLDWLINMVDKYLRLVGKSGHNR